MAAVRSQSASPSPGISKSKKIGRGTSLAKWGVCSVAQLPSFVGCWYVAAVAQSVALYLPAKLGAGYWPAMGWGGSALI